MSKACPLRNFTNCAETECNFWIGSVSDGSCLFVDGVAWLGKIADGIARLGGAKVVIGDGVQPVGVAGMSLTADGPLDEPTVQRVDSVADMPDAEKDEQTPCMVSVHPPPENTPTQTPCEPVHQATPTQAGAVPCADPRCNAGQILKQVDGIQSLPPERYECEEHRTDPSLNIGPVQDAFVEKLKPILEANPQVSMELPRIVDELARKLGVVSTDYDRRRPLPSAPSVATQAETVSPTDPAFLRGIEWGGSAKDVAGNLVHTCPECQGTNPAHVLLAEISNPKGHRADCKLAALIAANMTEGTP